LRAEAVDRRRDARWPTTVACVAAPSVCTIAPARRLEWPVVGFAVAAGLMLTALAVPPLLGWNVEARDVAPLNALWDPRVGPGTAVALVLGGAGVRWAPAVAAAARWPTLLLAAFGYGVAWMAALATVDGWGGIGDVLDGDNEYLQTARSVSDVSAVLHEYIDRIPIGSDGQWPVHVAGHPPGALLFFVLLARIGLGSGLAAGWVVLLIAATTPVAVLITMRTLGAEQAARAAAPFLVVCPAAVWSAVSADAMFAAFAAWGLCLLALGAIAASAARTVAFSLGAGVFLGWCVMLSYGLPLVGVLAVAVLVGVRRVSPLPWAAAAAMAVVLAFAVAGFSWWEAFPVLRTRYWDGIAGIRPAGYWLWGDLAALCFSAGPAVGAAVAAAVERAARRQPAEPVRPVVLLALAAVACIAIADASLMSKAETERIWLPFVPWLLLGTALIAPRRRRVVLAAQATVALLVQSLLFTRW
jgi:hypothetical protein